MMSDNTIQLQKDDDYRIGVYSSPNTVALEFSWGKLKWIQLEPSTMRDLAAMLNEAVDRLGVKA